MTAVLLLGLLAACRTGSTMAPPPTPGATTPALAMPAPELAATPNPLAGTAWRLAYVEHDGRRSHTALGAWLRFDTLEFTGHDGCNHLFGTYTASPSGFMVLRYGQTLMACRIVNLDTGETLTEDEMTLNALAKVFAFELTGDELRLLFRIDDAATPGIILLRRS